MRKPSRLKEEGRGGKLGAERRATLTAFILLALLSTLAFANAFQNDFAFDDRSLIVKNRLLKSFDHLPTLFTTHYLAGALEDKASPGQRGLLYRPLVLVTYALNYAVGGLDPFGYHLVNLLLHIAVGFLLYGLARQLGCSFGAAFAASALFAVHPLHTEAVTGIVGRAELLMALGVLLALRCYIHRSLLASLGAFAVALLSKEQAMMLPALLVLSDLATSRGVKGPGGWMDLIRGTLRRSLGYLLILGAYLALRAAVLKNPLHGALSLISFIDNPLAHVPWSTRLLTALKIAGKYLWLFVWPAKLSADYSYNAIPLATSLFEPEVLWAFAAWGGLLGLAVFSYIWGRRLAFFSIGFTVLTFLPASNLLLLIGTIMGERLFYLPSVGLCLLIGAGWDRVRAWAQNAGRLRPVTRVSVGVFSLVLLLLTARTILRNRDWRDTETLMQSAVRVVPRSVKVHYNLGVFHQERHEVAKALRAYEEAIDVLEQAGRLWPKLPDVHYTLGLAYAKEGRWQEAEAACRRALELDPRNPAIHFSLSVVLLKQGRYNEALAAAEAAIQLNPTFVEAHYSRAQALEALGRLSEAAATYEWVRSRKPDLPAVTKRLDQLHPRLDQ